jgi:hypothetical protein
MTIQQVNRSNLKMPLLYAAFIAGCTLVVPVSAHHGTAPNYKMDEYIMLKGIVTEFRWRNPHSSLLLDVKDESGKVTNYAIELPSPGLMARGSMGWTRHTFKVGDYVEFNAHPSRTGAPVAVGGCTQRCEVLVNGVSPDAGTSASE